MNGALPKQRSDLRVRFIDGEAVVLDRKGGFVHQLSQTATFIWKLCDGQMTIEAIAEEVTRTYDVDVHVARKDVADAIARFLKLNLLDSARDHLEPA